MHCFSILHRMVKELPPPSPDPSAATSSSLGPSTGSDISAHKERTHNIAPYPTIASSFQMLDDDSIHLILLSLCYTDVTRRLKQLWDLALTCKRLRRACLPFMFKRVMWPNKRIANIGDHIPMLPESLWPYIQYVVSFFITKSPDKINLDRNIRFHFDDDDSCIDNLVNSLPLLPRLAILSIHNLFTPPDALIKAIFRCPLLKSLSFEETPLDFDLPRTPCETLHTLQFKDGRDLRVSGSPQLFIRSWRESPGPRAYTKIEAARNSSDVSATTTLLVAHRSFIQHIELSSTLTSYRELAHSHWPILQTLTLSGPCPRNGESIMPILNMMPCLRELCVLYTMLPSRHSSPYWAISLPTKTAGGPPKLTLAKCLSNLRHLTVSNPHPLDTVFIDIPSSLDTLCLPSIREWPHHTKGISPARASNILVGVSACGARLRELRLFIDSEPTVDLINFVARSCPALQVLHLGTDVWPRPICHNINTSRWVSALSAKLS